MRTITKSAIIVCLTLQFVFLISVESEVISYCPAGCPNVFTGFNLGFPIPFFRVGQIWGCLTISSLYYDVSIPEYIGDAIFWTTVFWILEFYWPYDGCFGEWEVECAAWPCSDKERCKKRTLRRNREHKE